MRACLLALGVLSLCPLHLRAAALPIVSEVEFQPFVAQVRRLIEATDYLGAPFSAADKAALNAAMSSTDAKAAVTKLQETIDRYALFGVHINPEMRVKVAQGDAKPELMQDGWRQFLVNLKDEPKPNRLSHTSWIVLRLGQVLLDRVRKQSLRLRRHKLNFFSSPNL